MCVIVAAMQGLCGTIHRNLTSEFSRLSWDILELIEMRLAMHNPNDPHYKIPVAIQNGLQDMASMFRDVLGVSNAYYRYRNRNAVAYVNDAGELSLLKRYIHTHTFSSLSHLIF
jgi:hypothetical protein